MGMMEDQVIMEMHQMMEIIIAIQSRDGMDLTIVKILRKAKAVICAAIWMKDPV